MTAKTTARRATTLDAGDVTCPSCRAPLAGHTTATLASCMGTLVRGDQLRGVRELADMTERPANRVLERLTGTVPLPPAVANKTGRQWDLRDAVPHILAARRPGPDPQAGPGAARRSRSTVAG